MTSEDWQKIKFFKQNEFDSPDSPGSGINMDLNFLITLDTIRFYCNFPFHINSGYRTQVDNAEVKGVQNSAHTKGLAADIVFADHTQLFMIMFYALQNGIKRVGVSFKSNFIHLDMDKTLPQNVIWTYDY